MQADAPLGVAGDVARDDAGASREVAKVESFFGKARMIPAAHFSAIQTPVLVYYNGGWKFSVHFGSQDAEFVMWTDERGLEAIIGSCQAALVRARIAREAVA